MSQRLSGAENASLGAFGGWLDVTLLQSTNYLKNAKQQGLPFASDIRVLYRGYAANSCNNAVGIMSQFFLSGVLKKVVTGGTPRPLTPVEQISTGFGAGFLSGIVCGPMELVMIQQQRKGGSLPATAVGLAKDGVGTVCRGALMTSWREGIYTAGFLGIVPVVRQQLMERFPDSIGSSTESARFGAALIGGPICCYLSHPSDTIKTCLQGDIERVKFGNARETARVLIGEGGLTSLWRGAPWRLFRQVCAVFLLDKVAEELAPIVFPHRFD